VKPRPLGTNRRPPWMEEILADWRRRWPAAFTTPVPLAIGASGQIKAALIADGTGYRRKTLGVTFHVWTVQSAYLRAVARGDMRRNLDGSEAGAPDDASRSRAQMLLAERAENNSKREERERSRRRIEVTKNDEI
jgi:sRNA-binding protein